MHQKVSIAPLCANGSLRSILLSAVIVKKEVYGEQDAIRQFIRWARLSHRKGYTEVNFSLLLKLCLNVFMYA